ncbi:DUF418 domain-containing protein [uncultured Sphingomonas sp.]|nr:DUF418 domain-containing protein [uncultured Sphingomonas sp.]
MAMPDAGYINPRAYGGGRPIDDALWAVNFVLFEGKMRGLFSLLFGASMALVVDGARANGEEGASVHYRRMFWLLLFGLAHHILIWANDILFHYAVIGAVAYLFLRLSNQVLRRWAVGLLVASIALHFLMAAGMHATVAQGTAPAATTAQRQAAEQVLRSSEGPGTPGIADHLKTYRSNYRTIVKERSDDVRSEIVFFLVFLGPETLGLMILGILLLRNGFLTGKWPDDRLRPVARWGYLLGIPPSIALAVWQWSLDFSALPVFTSFIAWAEPFRYAIILAHAAFAVLVFRRFAGTALAARIAAVGRAAFTNYLGTSLLMTTLFYGYGLGLYGHVGRAEVYLFIFGVWILMLLWSKPWLDRFRYGPLEWLWRSLARGSLQPMRRAAA